MQRKTTEGSLAKASSVVSPETPAVGLKVKPLVSPRVTKASRSARASSHRRKEQRGAPQFKVPSKTVECGQNCGELGVESGE